MAPRRGDVAGDITHDPKTPVCPRRPLPDRAWTRDSRGGERLPQVCVLDELRSRGEIGGPALQHLLTVPYDDRGVGDLESQLNVLFDEYDRGAGPVGDLAYDRQ